jgi:hypothetical protein
MHADDIRANNFISNETSYNQMVFIWVGYAMINSRTTSSRLKMQIQCLT